MEYYVESREHQTVSINANNLVYLPHLHQEIEVVTVTCGRMIVTINGLEYTLQQGDCAIIQPYSIHSYLSTDSQCIITIFMPDLVPALRNAICNTSYAEPVWKLSSKEYLYAIQQLLTLHPQKDDTPLIKGYLYVACSVLLSHLSPLEQERKSLDTFQQILQYVNSHFDTPITILSIAHRFGFSYEHLSRVYRENTALTFSQHVRLLRIDKAKRLLRETELSIDEIASECGYASERTLYRVFREVTGTTPRHFRQNQ